jgi:hypothetical protein
VIVVVQLVVAAVAETTAAETVPKPNIKLLYPVLNIYYRPLLYTTQAYSDRL